MAKALRNKLGAMDPPASFSQDAAEMLRPSSTQVAWVMFGRSAFAFRSQRWYIYLGAKVRSALISTLGPEDASAQDWALAPFGGEWPFPITFDGRLRSCAAPRLHHVYASSGNECSLFCAARVSFGGFEQHKLRVAVACAPWCG